MSKVSFVKDCGSTPEYSHVRVRLEGVGPKARNTEADSFYRCVGGTCVFTIGGHKHLLEQGDTLLVPKDVAYQDMSSRGADLEVCTIPPFDPSTVEYL